jgi:NADH-quinone oxidoreductase subunit E
LNDFLLSHSKAVKEILAKYPKGQERSAVMPLLHLAQRDNDCISRHAIRHIAEILGISTTEIASIIGFYTLYHMEDEATHFRIQVCTDLACALCGADRFLEDLCNSLGIKPGETTPDGLVTIEEVTCLAGCDRVPLLQVQGEGSISYHENQTLESAVNLINQLRADKPGGGQ